MVAPSRHPEVHELAASGAAEAALLGLGLEKDAEILSRIVEEKTKPEGNRDEGLLAHLYFARGAENGVKLFNASVLWSIKCSRWRKPDRSPTGNC